MDGRDILFSFMLVLSCLVGELQASAWAVEWSSAPDALAQLAS